MFIRIASFVLMAVSITSETAGQQLWHGTFQSADTSGAMELRIGGGQEANLKFAPDARPSESAVSAFRVEDRRISFNVTLADKPYRFEGARRAVGWQGSLVAAENPRDRGTWRLSRLDVEDKVSTIREPLPAPTGPFAIGRVAFSWIDETRPELETRLPDDKRELLVYVFYPSDPAPTAQRASYMPEADVMLPYWKDDLTKRLKSFRAFSRENVPLARGRDRLPIVLFAPGGGQKVLAYTTLLEDLASHGYLVAAIEPPYNAPAMQFPNGRTFGRLTPAERGWEEPKTRDDQPRIYEQMVLHWARDMSFVLDRLTDLNKPGTGLFAGRLDLGRVGALGHSRRTSRWHRSIDRFAISWRCESRREYPWQGLSANQRF